MTVCTYALHCTTGDEEKALKPRAYLHTRNKTAGEQWWRAGRKLGCCACTATNCFCLNLWTLCFFSFCCFLPRMLGATFKGTCSMSSAVALILGFILAVACYILLAAVLPE
jgi:hypothetical protein